MAEFNGSLNDTKRFSKGYNHFNKCNLPDYYQFDLAVDMTGLNCPNANRDFLASKNDLEQRDIERGNEDTSTYTENSGADIQDGDIVESSTSPSSPKTPKKIEAKTINDLIKLNEIYFEFDKWDITKRAEVELNKVIHIMNNEYPDMIIKIETHSDSRGNEYYNLLLSQKRAESIYNYLTSNDIPKSRILSYIGFGETKPV